jgi:predicted nucleic acid-binding protein
LPEVISDTSPLQYLHQLGLLHILPALAGHVIVPSAVEGELLVGRELGIDLPDLGSLDWVEIRQPNSRPALPLINDLGPGETETLMLALELPASIVLLDDGLARRVAESLEIQFTGTLGLLLDAKKQGLIPSLRPLLDQLQTLRFRLSPQTRSTILELAGEKG